MKHIFLLIVFTAICTADMAAQGKYDQLIFPDTTKKIILVVADDGNKNNLLSGKQLAGNDPFGKKIMNELNLPFHQSVIRLNQCSRNFSGDTHGPNVLFLSNNEGGFPRHGLAIREEGTVTTYPDLNYVDLVVREDRMETGAISIFSHELGHVMMDNIWDSFPEQISPKQHVSMGITDYYKAFAEGWGIHFQRLAYDNVPLYQSAFYKMLDWDKINKLWHSNIDEYLRINAVVNNGYIYQKLVPVNIDQDTLSIEDLILLEHTSPVFEFTKLKNAQQMLSSEGVLATIFYRINTDKNLQNNYQPAAFYRPFLLSGIPAGISANDIFTPFENVMLKNFWVWNRIKKIDFHKHQLMMEFIKEWCNSFPGDKNEIIKLLIAVTNGKTISNELGNIYEKTAWFGSIGNISQFRSYSNTYLQTFGKLKGDVMSDISLLEKNIGPELWVENNRVKIRTTLWSNENKMPLMININTASEFEVASFWNRDMSKAKRFIKKRNDIGGFFTSLEEAAKYGYRFK